MFNLIGRKGVSKKSFLAFSLVDLSALIINFEGREVKGLWKDRYDETFTSEDVMTCALRCIISAYCIYHSLDKHIFERKIVNIFLHIIFNL